MKNYYAILEVPVGCPVSEVREAYRRLVQENLWNKDAFAELKEAYEVLTTPTRRNEYDKATFGETFSSDDGPASLPAPDMIAHTGARHCPMGAAAQCPVIGARVPLQETFCPECGFLLAALTTEAFEPVALPDRSRQPRLEDASGRLFLLRAGINTVGREAADVLLPDKTVSRRHAQITVGNDGGVSVEDLDSTNGTRVEGEAVVVGAPRPVNNGAHVQFGSIDMRLRQPAPGPEEPSALGKSPKAAGARARLVSVRGGAAREFSLVPGVTTFGRRTENSVVLGGDPYISGYHAQIIADGDTFRLTDLGSTNGTLINGQPMTPNEPHTLVPGDEVVLGSMAYRFERTAQADALPETTSGDADASPEDTTTEDAGGEVSAPDTTLTPSD